MRAIVREREKGRERWLEGRYDRYETISHNNCNPRHTRPIMMVHTKYILKVSANSWRVSATLRTLQVVYRCLRNSHAHVHGEVRGARLSLW